MRAVLVWIIGLVMAVALPLGTISAAPAAPQRKTDLADSASGTYYGDIISDAWIIENRGDDHRDPHRQE